MASVARAEPVSFLCAEATLVGVLHSPPSQPDIAVIIVVGGPQYRVGSHRQFLLLARDLASRGIAVLRFDCRGMGDSDGEFASFEAIEPDIAAAVDFLARRLPGLRSIVLWGLCDATLAICAHAARDSRVGGVVLLNPWVRSEAGQSRARLRHYYLQRVTQLAFLRKILRGEFNPVASARDLLGHALRAFAPARSTGRQPALSAAVERPLADRMADNLARFPGRTLLIISGRDLTAQEFEDETRRSKRWRRLYRDPRLTRRSLEDADHTFSRREWRDEAALETWEWLRSWATNESGPSQRGNISSV
jgi:uncharacterized protein